jgi:hypothetical protein
MRSNKDAIFMENIGNDTTSTKLILLPRKQHKITRTEHTVPVTPYVNSQHQNSQQIITNKFVLLRGNHKALSTSALWYWRKQLCPVPQTGMLQMVHATLNLDLLPQYLHSEAKLSAEHSAKWTIMFVISHLKCGDLQHYSVPFGRAFSSSSEEASLSPLWSQCNKDSDLRISVTLLTEYTSLISEVAKHTLQKLQSNSCFFSHSCSLIVSVIY